MALAVVQHLVVQVILVISGGAPSAGDRHRDLHRVEGVVGAVVTSAVVTRAVTVAVTAAAGHVLVAVVVFTRASVAGQHFVGRRGRLSRRLLSPVAARRRGDGRPRDETAAAGREEDVGRERGGLRADEGALALGHVVQPLQPLVVRCGGGTPADISGYRIVSSTGRPMYSETWVGLT